MGYNDRRERIGFIGQKASFTFGQKNGTFVSQTFNEETSD